MEDERGEIKIAESIELGENYKNCKGSNVLVVRERSGDSYKVSKDRDYSKP